MSRALFAIGFFAAALALAAGPGGAVALKVETFTLPNGLTVTVHEDHTLPQVVINVWYDVGSQDERPGRTGFAHLFEHLMFMGTTRVPGNQFDMLMESFGGSNNASTNEDRTDYFSVGPTEILPTLLWLDADRMDGLGKAMTAEKLELQRSVVRNERRQNYENRPYGAANLILADALYPKSHPYNHPVIGSHEDLAAATLEDVKAFFDAYYVPGNASLVVAGDLDPIATRKLVTAIFGAVPARPVPEAVAVAPATLEREVRRLATDRVQFPRLYLAWHSPAAYAAGDAEMDIAAAVLADGETGRLYKRLVQDERLAQDVTVYQSSGELGSALLIIVTAAPGADLEQSKRSTLEELDLLKQNGPTAAEMARVLAQIESRFLRRKESLLARATLLNEYRHYFGVADAFDRDLERRLAPKAAAVRDRCRQVLGAGRVDLRVLPLEGDAKPANLDAQPANLPAKPVSLSAPQALKLANGVPLHVLPRPGTGLFSGVIVVDGGERLVPIEKAGLAPLAATGQRDVTAFADTVAALGAEIEAGAQWHAMTVSVNGLASKLSPTLDLLADAVLRPRLAAADFEREKELAIAGIEARSDSPNAVAWLVGRALVFGAADPRGRPTEGHVASVQSIVRTDVQSWLPRLLAPANARIVFVGDLDPAELKRALDTRLAGWQGQASAPPLPAPLERLERGQLVVVHRPNAPQTLISISRPIPPTDDRGRADRTALNMLFGGSFTSRLMQNIREKHGYSYGARSAIDQQANQLLLGASASVQTTVTGAALAEFKKEFGLLASGNVGADELNKAVRLSRFDLVGSTETVTGQAEVLADLLASGRPLDATGRDLAALDAVALEGALRQAHSGIFDWSSLLVVLVGDRDAILPQLAAAGFPAPRVLDSEGRPLAEAKPGT
jgi:zinc protease